jgi:peptidoglycan/LPS O-acetylase OafA/YrhL
LVFFLLSGFVIFANERTRAVHPTGYYLRRIRRIYPTLIAAMLVSTLVAIDNRTFFVDFRWQELLGTLVSIQDIAFLKPGVIVDPYLHNDPLWSLSHEVAFYLMFPPVLNLWLQRPSWANHAIGIACCTGYVMYVVSPNHWSLVVAYFLIWWCGAMAAEAYLGGARDVRSIGAPFYWLLVLAIIAAIVVFVIGYRGLGVYPFLMLRHFAFALIMLAVLFGPFGARIASMLCRFAKPAGAIASVSYGIYVLHHPILVDWHRARNGWGLPAAMVLLAASAYLTDRMMNRCLPRAPSD